MIVEEFVQRVLAKTLIQAGLPFYDVLPTDVPPLPCVNLINIQLLRVMACVVECRVNIIIFSQNTTKRELYDLAEETLKVLLSISNEKVEGSSYVWTYCALESTDATVFNPIEQAAAGIQFMQTYSIRLNITIDKKCGDLI